MLQSAGAIHERETGGDEELREMSMESMRRLINQLKEEIIWKEAHEAARR